MKKIKVGINGFGRIGRLHLELFQTEMTWKLLQLNDPLLMRVMAHICLNI